MIRWLTGALPLLALGCSGPQESVVLPEDSLRGASTHRIPPTWVGSVQHDRLQDVVHFLESEGIPAEGGDGGLGYVDLYARVAEVPKAREILRRDSRERKYRFFDPDEKRRLP